jgi:hypothetical protein
MELYEKLHENVYRYKNAIENPSELIKAIEDTESNPDINSVVPVWKDWASSSADGVNFGKKKDLNLVNVNQLNQENKEKAEYIINTIRDAISRVAKAFVKDRGLNFEPNTSPFVGVSKYLTGCYMGAHFDAQAGDQSLQYSMIFYLNDDYEGGEISFIIREPDLRLPENDHLRPKPDIDDPTNKDLVDFWLKPNPGDALIFPSTAPYRHQVHIMKSGVKYIIPGFIFNGDYVPEGY